MSDKLTHIDAAGKATMVDVSQKDETSRIAIAVGSVKMHETTLQHILSNTNKKGDVIATARIAGIMAAKQTSNLIPLCHPLMLNKVGIEIEADHDLPGLRLEAIAKVSGKTGVEMEALTAITVASLTIYDMAKAVDRGMVIGEIALKEKMGGKSGHWRQDKAEQSSHPQGT